MVSKFPLKCLKRKFAVFPGVQDTRTKNGRTLISMTFNSAVLCKLPVRSKYSKDTISKKKEKKKNLLCDFTFNEGQPCFFSTTLTVVIIAEKQRSHRQQHTVQNSQFAKSASDWRLKSIVCRLTVSRALGGPAELRRSPISARLQTKKHQDKENIWRFQFCCRCQ